MIIDRIPVDDYESVYKFRDDEGFSAYIAVHSTRLGPALGGCRIKEYDTDDAALLDVLRLAKGMTYKNSLADLNFGGGKCVVNAPKATPAIMTKVGRAIECLGGIYISAADVGTTLTDLLIAAERTSHIVAAGDPSPWTALGVFYSILSAMRHTVLTPDMRPRVHVEGLGKVGWRLTELLAENNFRLYVSDLKPSRVEEAMIKLNALPYEASSRVEIYAPCAMGPVVTPENINALDMLLICGAANNQLATDDLADRLSELGILYCPDYLVNAGGVISVADEFSGFDEAKVSDDVFARGEVLDNVIRMAELQGVAPLQMANALAQARL